MASSSVVEDRRLKVADLWLVGTATSAIARQLAAPERTVRRDIQIIRQRLDRDRLTEVEERRQRSIAVLRKTQHSAWTVYYRVQDSSVNKIAALNVVRECEVAIAKLEGTWNSEITVTQSQTTNNIWLDSTWLRMRQVIATALFDHPEARLAVAEALATMEEDGNAAES